MKIIVDMMGGDNAPLAVLEGAAQAVKEYGVNVVGVGDEALVRKTAQENSIPLDGIELVNCTEVIDMCDEPARAIRQKKDSSIVVGLNMLKDGKGDAFVSAGSTGALHVGASLIVRTLKGIKRPALATMVPAKKQAYLLLDCGANVECRPEMLAAFAVGCLQLMLTASSIIIPDLALRQYLGVVNVVPDLQVFVGLGMTVVPLVLRRRFPLPVFAACLVIFLGLQVRFSGFSMTVVGPLVALYTVAAECGTVPGVACGAAAVLSEIDLGEKPFPYIRVGSSLQAVKDIAEFYLKQLHIPVIGIAGSVGKTSTKEMAYSVLRQKFNVLKTEGNFNNELGVPLTIFRLRDEHEMAVLEMGISDFGEMHRLAKIARPNTVIMTNIGYCHVENLIDRDGILKAKTEIFDFLESDAHIILNGDDDKLATITDVRGIKPVTFGFAPERDIWADELKSLGLKGTACHIHTPVGDFHATVGMPGRHMVANALAGTAVGLAYGLTLDQIKTGIEANESLSGRFNIIDTDRYTIIDDCYNANPVSMKASLEVLQDGANRRVAILGDMG